MLEGVGTGINSYSYSDYPGRSPKDSEAPIEAKIAEVSAINATLGQSKQQFSSKLLEQASDIVTRIGQVSARATDSTLSIADRKVFQEEANQLTGELKSLVNNSRFNGSKVLQGGTYSSFVEGNHKGQNANGSSFTAPLDTLDLSSAASAQLALDNVQTATNNLTAERVKVANSEAAFSRAGDISALKSANLQAANTNQGINDFHKKVSQLKSEEQEVVKQALLQNNLISVTKNAFNKFL